MAQQHLVDFAALLLRVSLALMFFAHAYLKIVVFTPAGTAKYFSSLGVPGFSLTPRWRPRSVADCFYCSGSKPAG
jgi:uncharacterized membrane protein YphA (DoxX/SURF4 family)